MFGDTELTKPSGSRVERINNYSGRRPLLFTLSTLVTWMVLASTGVLLIATLTRNPITDPLPQSAGALIATVALITVMGWLGWIQGSGIGRLGDWWHGFSLCSCYSFSYQHTHMLSSVPSHGSGQLPACPP